MTKMGTIKHKDKHRKKKTKKKEKKKKKQRKLDGQVALAGVDACYLANYPYSRAWKMTEFAHARANAYLPITRKFRS